MHIYTKFKTSMKLFIYFVPTMEKRMKIVFMIRNNMNCSSNWKLEQKNIAFENAPTVMNIILCFCEQGELEFHEILGKISVCGIIGKNRMFGQKQNVTSLNSTKIAIFHHHKSQSNLFDS